MVSSCYNHDSFCKFGKLSNSCPTKKIPKDKCLAMTILQQNAAAQAAKAFRDERIPKYFDHFEAAYGKSDGPFVAGERWSHVDTSIFQLIEGLRYAFPDRMNSIEGDYPKLIAARDAVARIDGVAAYLGSDKRLAFNEDGIFRHYKELDGT